MVRELLGRILGTEAREWVLVCWSVLLVTVLMVLVLVVLVLVVLMVVAQLWGLAVGR